LTWKPWIEIEPLETNDMEVIELYNRAGVASENGKPPDLVRLTSMTPEVSGLIFDLSRTVHSNSRGLTLKEQRMVALVVAVFNGCVH